MFTEPLVGTEQPESFKKRAAKKCGKCVGITALVAFIGVWIVQGCAFWYGLDFSCTGGEIKGFHPYSDDYNLVPRISLLTQRPTSRYGDSFDSIPSSEASTVAEAPTGVWWATWGPLYRTYTYQDVATSKPILYMRRNLLRLGMSHRIGRCDGQGPYVEFNEGSLWFQNRFRQLFGLNQGVTLKLYIDGELYGEVKETNKVEATLSFTVRNDEEGDLASSVLQGRQYHGKHQQWLVKTKEEGKGKMPYWVTEGIAALFAFSWEHKLEAIEDKSGSEKNAPASRSEKPTFLAALDNATMPTELSSEKPAAESMTEIVYNNPRPVVKETVTHSPPHWEGAHDVQTPALAWMALIGLPLLGIPCMVKCKNGNLQKLF